MANKAFHIVMHPWFALGHFTSFLHLSNKLDERGHKISFFLPPKCIPKFEPFNLHPDLISFFPVSVPDVDGLPPGSETTADVPFPLLPSLMTAVDLTEPVIESLLLRLKPDFVFFDFSHWLPATSKKLGIKSVHYCTVSPASIGYLISPERKLLDKNLTAADYMNPPPSFPKSHSMNVMLLVSKPV